MNAVDHLGTVAYKLTDLLEQQTLNVSTMELKVSCLKQVICIAVSLEKGSFEEEDYLYRN